MIGTTIPLVKTELVVARTTDVLLVAQNNPQVINRFILEIDQELPLGNTNPTTITQNGISAGFTNCIGSTVRTDMLNRAIEYRKLGVSGYCPVECNNYRFRCVVQYDPLRVIVIDKLPDSYYSPTIPVTTSTTSTACTTSDIAADLEVPNLFGEDASTIAKTKVKAKEA